MKRTGLIIAFALGGCATDPQPVVSDLARATSGSDWQTVTVLGPGDTPGFRHFCSRISYAEAAAKAPLPLDLTTIAANQPALRGLGVLEYQGRGVEIRSDDPRFAALEIPPGRVMPRMPNGDFIEVANYIPYGEDTRPARCFAPWNPSLSSYNDEVPVIPAEIRDKLQSRPDIRLVGAAPLSPKAWLAMTAPSDGADRTLLVRVAKDGAQAFEVVAELPFAFQVIQPVMDFHSARRWVRLVGRGSRDEPIRVLLVEVPSALF